VKFVTDINAGGIRMDHLQAEVIALNLPYRFSPLLAVHIVPVDRLSVATVVGGLLFGTRRSAYNHPICLKLPFGIERIWLTAPPACKVRRWRPVACPELV
jgi:hypothetical protein